MSEWKEVRLGEVVQINPESLTKDYPFNVIDYIDISSVGTGELRETTQYPISEAPSRAKRLVRAGDTILSTVRPNRRSFLYLKKPKENQVVSTGFAVLRATEKINSRYLYYLISDQKFTDYLVSQEQGAAYPAVSIDSIKNAIVLLPDLETQEKIASILGSIDDKIELNIEMNKTLEEMAMTLYKHWFVDFGPFQDGEFVESELGMIPKGWRVSSLEEFANILMGQSPKSEFYNRERKGLPFHQGVKDFGIRYPVHTVYCTQELRVAKKGDILLSVRAPVGRINIANSKLVIGRGLSALNSKSGHNSFLLYTLKRIFAFEDQYGSGTVFNSISKKDIEQLKFIQPPQEVLDNFEKHVSKFDSLIESNTKEIEELQELRGYLLPRLLSGEIDVSQAEKQVEEVL
ncbi:restriction endonuclease subunit S [Anoxybacillus gonensis]|uniref:restriction endonuclease subunit S n=1 Tax=Anoxybacillus gonensis TaxID=198467 RepID=UPI003D767DCE